MLTKARAMATRCCSPPDSSCGSRFSLPPRPTISSVSGTTCRMAWPGRAEDLQGERDVLVDVLVRQQAEVLEDGADLAAQTRHLAVGQPAQLVAGDQHRPLGGLLLAQREPEQGRLAGPGLADDEDELAAADLEVDPAQGRPGRPGIDLGDVLETDHAASRPSRLGDFGGIPRLPGGTRGARSRICRRAVCAAQHGQLGVAPRPAPAHAADRDGGRKTTPPPTEVQGRLRMPCCSAWVRPPQPPPSPATCASGCPPR